LASDRTDLGRYRPDGGPPFRNSFESFNGGLFRLLPFDADDLPAVSGLMKRYEGIKLPFADAVLAHLAERENVVSFRQACLNRFT